MLMRVDSIEGLESCMTGTKAFRKNNGRPFITVSYAQSVDGSIATRNRQPIGLSGPKSMLLTHQIRACSDAILIGIGTILADDPRLNVRLVDGKNPQPIILDTHLRTPVNAKLVKRPDTRPWLINAAGPDNKRFQALCGAGTTPIDCNTSADGKIDLQSLMQILSVRGINSVMVEGGAQVITSFVNARLVDQFVVTISPRFIGGLSVLNSNGMHVDTNLELTEVSYRSLGDDLIIWAQPKWRRNLSAANNIDSD